MTMKKMLWLVAFLGSLAIDCSASARTEGRLRKGEPLADRSDSRQLQHIWVKDENGEIQYNIFVTYVGNPFPSPPSAPAPVSEPTTPTAPVAPVMEPTSPPEPIARTNARYCGNPSGELVGTARLTFTYHIETSAADITEEESALLMDTATKEMVDSIYNTKCQNRRFLVSTAGGHRSLEIMSISEGPHSRLIGNCEPTLPSAQGCHVYEGSLLMGFNEVGEDSTGREVGSTVVTILMADMEQDKYLPGMNTAMNAYSSSTTAEKVSFEGTGFFDANPVITGSRSVIYDNDEGNVGLTKLGKWLTPLAALLFLCFLVTCYASYRAYLHRSRNFGKDDEDTFDSDDMGLAKYRQQDVHVCNRLDCRACNRLPPLMEDVPKRFKNKQLHFEDVSMDGGDQDPDSVFMAASMDGQSTVDGNHRRFWNPFKRSQKQHQLRSMPSPEDQKEADDDEENLSVESHWNDELKSMSFIKVRPTNRRMEMQEPDYCLPVGAALTCGAMGSGVGGAMGSAAGGAMGSAAAGAEVAEMASKGLTDHEEVPVPPALNDDNATDAPESCWPAAAKKSTVREKGWIGRYTSEEPEEEVDAGADEGVCSSDTDFGSWWGGFGLNTSGASDELNTSGTSNELNTSGTSSSALNTSGTSNEESVMTDDATHPPDEDKGGIVIRKRSRISADGSIRNEVEL